MTMTVYSGRCHCGAVHFEAEADLQAGTVRCNCSICAKLRMWLAFVPPAQFRVISGEERLADYRFGAQRIRHRFCSICGVKPFGQLVDGSAVALNVACLDGLPAEQLARLPITYMDGATDCWDAPPAVTDHL